MRTALYPGVFDPITFGHIDIIKRASKIWDSLIIGVAKDVHHKNVLLSSEEREFLVLEEVRELGLSNVEVIPFSGLLINFAVAQKTNVIIRGLRALSDFEYEFKMAYINHQMNSTVETIFLPATKEGHFISSSVVKEIFQCKGDITQLVPKSVANVLKQKMQLHGNI